MAVHVLGARGHEPRVRVGGDVVVIDIERAPGDAVALRECVQLVQRAVRDQVRPQPAVCRPAGSSIRIATGSILELRACFAGCPGIR